MTYGYVNHINEWSTTIDGQVSILPVHGVHLHPDAVDEAGVVGLSLNEIGQAKILGNDIPEDTGVVGGLSTPIPEMPGEGRKVISAY